jgi:hypothetical protein
MLFVPSKMVTGKSKEAFFCYKNLFLSFFLPKTPRKFSLYFDKLIHDLKKPKKPSKNLK